MNQSRFWIYSMLLVFGVLPAFGDSAVDCDFCSKKAAQIAQIRVSERKTTELLGKNKEYLSAIGAAQASKFLKVQSNIVQVLKKLDQLKMDSRAAEVDFEKNRCVLCEQESAKKKDGYEKST